MLELAKRLRTDRAFRIDALGRLAFGALLATTLAHIWFASAPLPLGGPNIILAVLSVALAGVYVGAKLVPGARASGGLSEALREFRPIIPALSAALLLAAWIFAVHLFNDQLWARYYRQVALGVGVMLAAYAATGGAGRAPLLLTAMAAAVAVSALFGVGVLYIGDPFLSVWLFVSTFEESRLAPILSDGRTTGLAPDPVALSYQLAAAVPIAFAAALRNPFARGGRYRAAYDAAMFLALAIMATTLVINATRSAMAGALIGVIVAGALSAGAPRVPRRILFVAPGLALWLTAFFNPVYAVEDAVADADYWRAAAYAAAHDFIDARGDAANVPAAAAVADAANADESAAPADPAAVNPQPAQSAPAALSAPAAAAVEQNGGISAGAANAASASAAAIDEEPIDIYEKPAVVALAIDEELLRVGPQGLRIGIENFAGESVAAHTIADLPPQGKVTAQLLWENDWGFRNSSEEIVSAVSDEGELTLVWNEIPAPLSAVYHWYRLRPSESDEWTPWEIIRSPMRSDSLIIAGAASGEGSLASGRSGAALGYRVDGLIPMAEYDLQLRAHYGGRVYGNAAEVSAAAETAKDGGGFIAVSWDEPDGPNNGAEFQIRVRESGAPDWGEWRGFVPNLRSAAPFIDSPAVSLELPDYNFGVMGHRIDGLVPGGLYMMQLRAHYNEWVFGDESEFTFVAGDGGGGETSGFAVASWRPPEDKSSVTGYQYRLKQDGGDWTEWKSVHPDEMISNMPPRPGHLNLYVAQDGDQAAGGERLVNHSISGLFPDTPYSVQVRAMNGDIAGEASEAVGGYTTESGRIAVEWPLPSRGEKVDGYQYRAREGADAQWQEWQDFTVEFEYESVGEGPPVYGLIADWGRYGSETSRNHTLVGLPPGAGYEIQVRVQNENGEFGEPSAVAASASDEGVIDLSWERPKNPADEGEYQLRSRALGASSEWGAWRGFTPGSLRVHGMRASEDGLARGANIVGYTFDGLKPSISHESQVRAVSADGFGPGSDVAVNYSDRSGSFRMNWYALDPSANVAGYQFRLKGHLDDEWRPWVDFVPNVSGKVPPIIGLAEGAVGEGGEPTVSYTITGLDPGTRYNVSVRARSELGFGRLAKKAMSSSDDGAIQIAWNEPEDPSSVGNYQFRLRPVNKEEAVWRDFASPTGGAQPLAEAAPDVDESTMAQMALYMIYKDTNPIETDKYSEFSVRARPLMAAAAWRYFMDNPLGTGIYALDDSHLRDGLSSQMRLHLLENTPHNQFLNILVFYGIPGIVLLAAFYLLLARSLIRSGWLIMRTGDPRLCFVFAAVVGALIGYGINSMAHNASPFRGDWHHFVIFGLAFCLERMAVSRFGGAGGEDGAVDSGGGLRRA